MIIWSNWIILNSQDTFLWQFTRFEDFINKIYDNKCFFLLIEHLTFNYIIFIVLKSNNKHETKLGKVQENRLNSIKFMTVTDGFSGILQNENIFCSNDPV